MVPSLMSVSFPSGNEKEVHKVVLPQSLYPSFGVFLTLLYQSLHLLSGPGLITGRTVRLFNKGTTSIPYAPVPYTTDS